MGVFKVIGGAVLGVAAVAAVPFTGGGSVLAAATLVGSLTGVGTAAVAAGAGVAGGVAASKMSKEAERKKKASEDREHNLRKDNAERVKREEKLKEKLKAKEYEFKENKEYEEYVTAMFAIAFSVANCDGEMHPMEVKDIEEFIKGESYKVMPKSLKNSIEDLKNNPPSLNTALQYVNRVSRSKWDIFDDIINVVIMADGKMTQEEVAFGIAWKNYKSAV